MKALITVAVIVALIGAWLIGLRMGADLVCSKRGYDRYDEKVGLCSRATRTVIFDTEPPAK